MKNRLAILLVLALTGVLLSSLPAHADSNPLKFVGVTIDMGIDRPGSAAQSPDEKFVYVASWLMAIPYPCSDGMKPSAN